MNNQIIIGLDINQNKGAISLFFIDKETEQIENIGTFTFPFENKKIKIFGKEKKSPLRDWYATNYISRQAYSLLNKEEEGSILSSKYDKSDIIFVFEKNTQGTSYSSTLQTGKVLMSLWNAFSASCGGMEEVPLHAITWRSWFKLGKKGLSYEERKKLSQLKGQEEFNKYSILKKELNSDEADATLIALCYIQKILRLNMV